MSDLSVSAQTRLLVVAPHPDDETLGCGVLIQRVLAAGGAVQVLLLTDGDNNPWPQRYIERRLRIDAAGRRRWGGRRRGEVLQAIAALGLPASALHAMGWPDMGLTALLRDEGSRAIAAVQAVMQGFQPNLVSCPGLRDSHPDHGAAHVLCCLALAGLDRPPSLFAYPVHGHADASAYPVLVDAAPGQQQRKLQALAEHVTQMRLSGARLRRLALSPERYMQVERAPGAARLPWRPPVLLQPWLRLLAATPAGAVDFRWPDAVVSAAGGGYQFRWPPGRQPPGPAFVKLHLDWPSPWIFDHWGWHAV
ncbi:PIG-L deacetylase family protein [Dyella acidiphila]|uniref:PIG-L family deacetylase n=1 Tax=Dyella acidiphila TaxID=2775866 RepID=A0ABR9GB46_9GAMM|nr:PIG-L family deacetylase [Dyella acidiphila]MBE1161252.1 PIG-L family deacetylase [Dyella acidiphila]